MTPAETRALLADLARVKVVRCLAQCFSPNACKNWGYCRQRNIDAGGMENVTPIMQGRWRQLDGPTPPNEPGDAGLSRKEGM